MAYTPSSPDNVRLTITVTPEVHAAFKRLAEASGMSISRAMGDWLGDTLEAAETMTTMVEKARAAPRLALQEIQAYALGLSDETGELIRRVRAKGEAERRAEPAGPSAPRSVIRGGKSPSGKTRRPS